MDFETMKRERGRISMKTSARFKEVNGFMVILQKGDFNPRISWEENNAAVIRIFREPSSEDLKFIHSHPAVEKYEDSVPV